MTCTKNYSIKGTFVNKLSIVKVRIFRDFPDKIYTAL